MQSQHSYALFSDEFRKIQTSFLRAIIDNDKKKVIGILDSYPAFSSDLLLTNPDENMVVQSHKTWQKFYAEHPLMMSIKRRQIEMSKLLLAYINTEQNDNTKKVKAQCLTAWKPYPTHTNVTGDEEITIPEEYTSYAQELIKLFTKEKLQYGDLSDEAKRAHQVLFNKLNPENAQKLDDAFDVPLFLLAIYKKFWSMRKEFQTSNQIDAFKDYIVGLIQSFLPPEPAIVYCASLFKVIEALEMDKESQMSPHALAYQLDDGTAFYRSQPDLQKGLGYDFHITAFGTRGLKNYLSGGTLVELDAYYLEKLCLETNKFLACKLYITEQPIHHSKNTNSNCVIC